MHLTRCLVILILPACVYGPEVERKSPLNKLSGEHYNATTQPNADVLFELPVVKRRQKATTVSGLLYQKNGMFKNPVKFQQVVIKNPQGKIVAKGSSDLQGKYKIIAPLKNGKYFLHLDSDKKKATEEFTVEKYDITIDLEIKS